MDQIYYKQTVQFMFIHTAIGPSVIVLISSATDAGFSVVAGASVTSAARLLLEPEPGFGLSGFLVVGGILVLVGGASHS